MVPHLGWAQGAHKKQLGLRVEYLSIYTTTLPKSRVRKHLYNYSAKE